MRDQRVYVNNVEQIVDFTYILFDTITRDVVSESVFCHADLEG